MAIRLMITAPGNQRPPYRRAIGMPIKMLADDETQGFESAGEHQQQHHADANLGQGFAIHRRIVIAVLDRRGTKHHVQQAEAHQAQHQQRKGPRSDWFVGKSRLVRPGHQRQADQASNSTDAKMRCKSMGNSCAAAPQNGAAAARQRRSLNQAELFGQHFVVRNLLLHVGVQLRAGHGEREQFTLIAQLGEFG